MYTKRQKVNIDDGFRCIRCWTVLLGIWQSTWLVWTTRITCALPAGISSGH